MGFGGWTASTALAALPLPCATLELLPEAPPLAPIVAPAVPPGEKAVRDPYDLPNTATSANFAAHWGDEGAVDPADVERLLAAFEEAWAVQIERMDHPRPPGTDAFRFNVYVGDTGDGAPSSYGAAGYYWVDHQGQPMVVVASAVLWDDHGAAATAHHEFYHAIQGASGRYTYEDPAAWFWEATAEWAAIETDPDNPANGAFAFGYLLLPELPANFFDYPDSGALQEYHQYGAFLLPHDLSRQVGWELVRDAWTDPGAEADPLEVMRAWLADRGHDLDALWLDHLAHNAAFDYDAGDRYRDTVTAFEPYFPDTARIVATVQRAGGEGEVSGEAAPRRYGGNTIALESPKAGTLVVAIAGDRQGSEGSPASYGARVVRAFADGTLAYHEVPFDGRDGFLEIPEVGDEEVIWLTVGAWTPAWDRFVWHDETFTYAWSLTVVEPEPPPTPTTGPGTPSDPGVVAEAEPEGCGCRGVAPGGLALPLLALVAARRQRARNTRLVSSAPSSALRNETVTGSTSANT